MNVIYHLAPAARWSTWPDDQPYLPSEFEREGFIHCTKGDELMVKVANQYQRKTPGDFVLLLVDVDRLDPQTSPVKWEESSVFHQLFPHIYGPINRQTILGVRQVHRTADGAVLGWSNS